jgi:hypothetical protein
MTYQPPLLYAGLKKYHSFPVEIGNPNIDANRRCKYCGLKAKNEHKKPECKRHSNGAGQAPLSETDGTKLGPRCYEKHPALKVGPFEIYGGSCGNPPKDADVLIGFDSFMRFTKASRPWANPRREEVLVKVTDYQAPENETEFGELVDWTIEQLKLGKKVHAGCIGGHGRTGTFLVAVVARFYEKHSDQSTPECVITYVRENYCKKAVESAEQVKFLVKHYGVKEAAGAKVRGTAKGWDRWKKADDDWHSGYESSSGVPKGSTLDRKKDMIIRTPSGRVTITPTPTDGNIWGSLLDEGDL